MARGRTRFDAAMDRKAAVRNAEAEGTLADSMAVRLELIRRMQAGELTLGEVQAELKRIKRNAHANGLRTMNEVHRNA